MKKTPHPSTDYAEVRARIRGMVLNQPTPFKPKTFEVDHEGLRKNIEFWIRSGVRVLMITAGTSDFTVMSEAEIREVTRTTVEAAAGRMLVIACTDTWWLGQTIEFARYCESCGADALMVIKHEPPEATAEHIHQFHRAIAKACRIPLVYHSALLGAKSVEVLRRVIEIPSVVGMKQEMDHYPQYALLRDEIGDRLAVVSGGGSELAFHAMQFGATGALTGIGQWAPRPEIQFVDQLLQGDFAGARRHLDRVLPFRRVAASLNNLRAIKYAMDLAGLAGGPPRPLGGVELTPEQENRLKAAIEATGLLKG